MDSVIDGLGRINDSICGSICGGGKADRRGGAGGSSPPPPPLSPLEAEEDGNSLDGTSERGGSAGGAETPPPTPPRRREGAGAGAGAGDESPTSVAHFARRGNPAAAAAVGTPTAPDLLGRDGRAEDPSEERDEEEEGEGADDGEGEGEWEGEEERERERERARADPTAPPWSAYLRGPRRPELFAASSQPLYGEFRARAPRRRGGEDVGEAPGPPSPSPSPSPSPPAISSGLAMPPPPPPPISGLAAAVARAIEALPGVTNPAFDPRGCVWEADYRCAAPPDTAGDVGEGTLSSSGGGGGGSEADLCRLNVRIYSLDAAALGDAEKKVRKKEKGEEEDDGMEDFVITTHLVGREGTKPEANKDAFKRVDAAVRSAAIRHELTAYLKGAKRGGKRSFAEEYDLGEELNSGAYAKVHKATRRSTGDVRAVKVIGRARLASPDAAAAVLFEVLLQASLGGHPRVVRLHDFYEEPDGFRLVMELAGGGDLFDRIAERRTYSERDARELVRNLLEALTYCHGRGVVHRDLKPKNMMLVDGSNDTSIKLADFGLSARVAGPQSLLRLCGSPFYVAPELLLRKPYDESSDMWSVGVIAYLLLGGAVPFNGTSLKEIFQKVVDGEYDFGSECWGAVSGEAKDLVRDLLRREPSDRPTAEEALRRPWFRVKDKKLAGRDLRKSALSLRRFEARMRFKSAVFAVQGMQRLAGNGFQWQYGLEGIQEGGTTKRSAK